MNSKKGTSKKQSVRTTENGQEFTRATRGMQLLNTVFHRFLKERKEHGQGGRLNARLLQVIQSDPLHDRGKRTISSGDLRLLEGFDFFSKRLLLRQIPTAPTVQVDRRHGKCLVNISSFMPQDWLPAESSATHIAIIAAAAAIDFDREQFDCHAGNSVPLAVQEETGVSFGFTVPKSKEHPIVVVVGVQFLQMVNGKSYPLAGLSLQVVKVEMPGGEGSRK